MDKKPYNFVRTLIVFFLLYMFQGILYGYITSLKYLMKSKGMSYQLLSIFDFVGSPSYFKFFFAPILDIYYSRRLGKRMTYISALSTISAVFFTILSFMTEKWIKNQDIWPITIVSFLLMVAICVQDVAIDSLVEEIFNESHTKFGPIMQTIGQIIGPLVSFNIFVYFYSSHPDLTFYLPLIFSVFIFGSTVWVWFNVVENPCESEFRSPLELIKIIPNFFKNESLRLWIFHILFAEIGINFWRHSLPMIMIDNGFTMTDMSKLGTWETIWAIASIIILFKLNMSNNPLKYIKMSYVANMVYLIFQFMITRNLEITKDLPAAYRSFLFTQPFVMPAYISFSASVTFTNLICDYSLSGTFLAVLNSLGNFSRIFYQPLFTFSMSLFNYKYVVLFSFAYSLLYLVFVMPHIFERIGKLKREDFSVSNMATKKTT